MLTDQFLINSNHGHIDGKRYKAVFATETKFFTASTLKDAKKIACEYGIRLMGGERVLLVEGILD